MSLHVSRRGFLAGAVATAVAASARPALASPPRRPGSARPSCDFVVPKYRTAVPGESLEIDRLDVPVAPGIVLTSFDTFGRTGWLRVHVLNADLRHPAVGVDVLGTTVSDVQTVSAAASHAVGAVNGDFFDLDVTNAAIGPEIRSGRLVKGTSERTTVPAVGADRVARFADLMLTGTVTADGVAYDLAALNSPSLPADGITAFTPEWGGGNRTLIADPGPYTELVVVGGKVSAVNASLTTTVVPANGVIVVGRGSAAAELARVQTGVSVAVTYQPVSPEPLRMALGSNAVLIRDGQVGTFPPDDGHTAPKPRTAIAWLDGGRRLLLVAVDGAANFSTGLSYADFAALLVRLGATDAFMLDGGGSTELVARHAGDPAVSVVNTPSDGNERPVPNAVGLLAQPGSGRLHGLDVRLPADRVVPGLSLDVAVAGSDETWAPAPVNDRTVHWEATPGSLGRADNGVFRARRPGAGVLRARSGRADGRHELRVVGELHRLAFSERAITIESGATASVTLIGADADGFTAPVAARDVLLDYDKNIVTVTAEPDGSVSIASGGTAGTSALITATVQGLSAKLPVTVGLANSTLAEFDAAEGWTATSAKGTAAVSTIAAADRPGAADTNQALRLTYDFTGQSGTSAAYAVAANPITLPPGTKRLSLWVNGDGRGHWLRAMLRSQGTTNVPFTFALVVDWTGWRQVVGDLPEGFSDPITLLRVYIAEISQTNKNAGQLDFDALTALVGQGVQPSDPPQPDPYVVEQAPLPSHGRWSFAVLSDLHISAAAGLDSFAGHQAVKALQQVVDSRPDFILINGDFVDDDNPADFELANGLLRDHVPSTLPVYWTPGNHEAGLSTTGGLDQFRTSTGRPNRQMFDHKGTRFILLDSHTGDMRTSDWDQVPLLQAELARAARDRSVTSVVVSFHHPLEDPSGAAASQLSDRLQADLFHRWLSDFRERSGKPIALFTGHAHTAAVSRADGLLEVTTPAVGKTPYSSPDQGGFFGWMHVAVDPHPARVQAGQPSPQTRDWLLAEVRPLIDGITITAPPTLAVGDSTPVSATGATSKFGLEFPLRFPASVEWGGSSGLVIASTASEVATARRHPRTLAVLDLVTGTLHAVRSGTVTVEVAAGGLTADATITLS